MTANQNFLLGKLYPVSCSSCGVAVNIGYIPPTVNKDNSFILGGPRIMNPGATLSEKMNMEEQLKQHQGSGQFADMFSPHNPMDAFQVKSI